MGIRERLQKGIRKRARKGRRERSTDTRTSGKRRRQLAKLKAALASMESAQPTREDDQARGQFARAERTAAAGPPVDATLDPSATPESIEALASGSDPRRLDQGDLAVDQLVTGRSDESKERTMEGLVLGEESDERTGLEEMATGGFGREKDDDQGSFFWGDY